MKLSLTLGSRDSLDRQTAQACVATNLGLPGFGSLLAGRAVGYAQAALTLAGFGLTLLLGVKFIVWAVSNWPRLYGPEADPLETLLSMWLNVRGALLGIALFIVSWLWALMTNFSILRSASGKQDAAKPPKLNPT